MTRCGNCGTTGFGRRFGRRFQTCVRPYGDEETLRVKGVWMWTWTWVVAVADDEVVVVDAPLRSAGTNDFVAKMLGIIVPSFFLLFLFWWGSFVVRASAK